MSDMPSSLADYIEVLEQLSGMDAQLAADLKELESRTTYEVNQAMLVRRKTVEQLGRTEAALDRLGSPLHQLCHQMSIDRAAIQSAAQPPRSWTADEIEGAVIELGRAIDLTENAVKWLDRARQPASDSAAALRSSGADTSTPAEKPVPLPARSSTGSSRLIILLALIAAIAVVILVVVFG